MNDLIREKLPIIKVKAGQARLLQKESKKMISATETGDTPRLKKVRIFYPINYHEKEKAKILLVRGGLRLIFTGLQNNKVCNYLIKIQISNMLLSF